MVLLPDCNCCSCKPCPYCTTSRCFEVSFSGFKQLKDTFSNCSDCRHLDATTVVVSSRQAENPEVTLSAVDDSGTGAEFYHTLTKNADNSFSVASVSVTDGGIGYESPALMATSTQSSEGYVTTYDTAVVCKQPTAKFTLSSGGVISGIELIDGGVFWPGSYFGSPCGYGGCVCGGCPEQVVIDSGVSVGMRSYTCAELTFGNEQHGVAVSSSSGLALTASQRSVDSEGKVSACDAVTIESKNVSGCFENGTVSIESVDCETEPQTPCPMPEQIALTVKWPAYQWSQGWSPFINGCFFFHCQDTDAIEATYILDRITSFLDINNLSISVPCSTYYSGPYGTRVNFLPFGNVVTATISPPDEPPAWYLNPPERRTATAEVTGINGDQLTTIVVTDGGAGYEYQIQQRVEPHLTLTADTSGGGSGATFSVTLEQIGFGDDAVWGIASVEITNGGQGYPAFGSVGVSVAEDETIVEQATLTFHATDGEITSVTKDAQQARRQASVSVYGTNGSGANFVATQTRADAYVSGSGLQSGWAISDVTVAGNSGGGNYQDGELAVFTYSGGATVGCQPFGRIDTMQEQPAITGIQFLDSATYGRLYEQPPTGTGAAFTATPLSIVSKPARSALDAFWVFTGSTGYNWECGPTRERWGLDISGGTDVSDVIVNGGSGYQVGTLLGFTFSNTGYPSYDNLWSNNTINELPYLRISSVDSNGAITGVEIPDTGSGFAGGAGRFARDTGVARGVTITPECSYQVVYEPQDCRTGFAYIEDGDVATGAYFAVGPTGQTHTSEPVVTIEAAIGLGAQAEASVSGGAVSSISITNGGSGYDPQRVVWQVRITPPDVPFINGGGQIAYMCDGNLGILGNDSFQQIIVPLEGGCRSPVSNRLSASCPGQLLDKTYGLGIAVAVTYPTSDTLISGPGVGIVHSLTPLCDASHMIYGLPPLKKWWLTGGSAKIEAV